ncbi:oxidoreductase-like protein [Xylariaceae sp. FL0255]|nr:oxidoreductase-like protein [Xylariaceae sp. FL0255]
MIPTIDLSPFAYSDSHSPSDRVQAGRSLVAALHDLGFVQVIGSGISQTEISEALALTKALFDLPYDDKMKAPHPAGPTPHRGYSGLGQEKVYSKGDVLSKAGENDIGQSLRKISDFKESYEIGSESDPVQQNIWLPDAIFPTFRSYMTNLYERLCDVSNMIINALATGLDLDAAAADNLMELISERHCQLRLLHYPPISKQKLQNEMLARLPAHHDWGTFTLLFQDNGGGLELEDPHTSEFLGAKPQEGAFVLNIGDMLQRFSNDYFISALHRVSLPDAGKVPSQGIPARYSIPFFVCPDFSYTVSTHPRFISEGKVSKYEPIRFDQYGALISKYQYAGDNIPD